MLKRNEHTWRKMKYNSELKWSSLLQRHHKLRADKSCRKSFQSGPQFCHCFFSSALRKNSSLSMKEWCLSAPLPLDGLAAYFSQSERMEEQSYGSFCNDLSKVLYRASAAALVLWGAVPEHRKAVTYLDLQGHPGRNRASTISGIILHSTTEYSGLEGTHTDHPAQLLRE